MARAYPTEWNKFCKTINTQTGFLYYSSIIKANIFIGDLDRFAARYAIAEDFKGVNISNSSKKTRLGYEALMRALLVWSVVETYFKIFPVTSTSVYKCLSFTVSEKNNIETQLNAIGNDMTKFYSFISSNSNCNSAHRKNINKFLANKDFNTAMLLSAIRHVFGHGELSANVSNVNPKSIDKIVNILKKEILTKIDDCFTLLVQGHPEYYKV